MEYYLIDVNPGSFFGPAISLPASDSRRAKTMHTRIYKMKCYLRRTDERTVPIYGIVRHYTTYIYSSHKASNYFIIYSSSECSNEIIIYNYLYAVLHGSYVQWIFWVICSIPFTRVSEKRSI